MKGIRKNMLGSALLNPLNMFKMVGVFLPNDNYPYLNAVDKSLSNAFDKMFIYEHFSHDVDKIIANHGRKLKDFSSYVLLMESAKEEVKELHNKICDYVLYSEGLSEIVLSELQSIELDCASIYLELREGLEINSKDDKYLLRYSQLFEELCENILSRMSGRQITEEETAISSSLAYEDYEERSGSNMAQVIEFVPDENGKLSINVAEKETLHIYDKQKEDMKQLRKEVNKLDEGWGLDLKNPEDTIDDSYAYEEKIHTYRVILTKMVCLLNDANEDKYLIQETIFGEEIRKIKINKKFKKKSNLFDDLAHNPKSFGFKARFLTFLLNFMIEHLEEIPDACYKANKDGEFIEFEVKNEYLDTAMDSLADLITNMLEGQRYGSELLLINELIILLDSQKKKAIKKIDKIYEQTELLVDNIRRLGSSDSIAIDTLLKLSYMVTVNDLGKVKHVVSLNPDYKKRNNNATKILIEELGESLLEAREDDNDVNALYKYFLLSDPLLLAKWSDVNNNEELLTGLCAIKYFAFIVNNKKIDRFVKVITERVLL